jgi:branched-chain amino acid transport system ATP-binding protein
MNAALETEGLSVHYGGVRALADVDLVVETGQVVGLIGPNGAGKTTLIDAVGGFASSTGRVLLDRKDISGLEPHERAKAGLGRTWQAADLFDDLSVHENLSVAAGVPPWREMARGLMTGREWATDKVPQALGRLGIEDLAERQADQLTQGQRKLVGVARALISEPRVVCLDEPAAGLDTRESEDLGRRLRRLAAAGTAVLLVDHDMGLVLSVCDHVVVLNFGEVIARGTAQEVRRDHAVVEAYLGGAAKEVEAQL